MTAALTEFDQLVDQIMRQWKVPREKAEAAARIELGIQPKSALERLRDEATVAQLEDDVVERGDRMMGALGFTIVRLSQKRASKVTPGIPDRRYYHRRRRLAVWWEAKSATGRQRPDQREFQILCDDVGESYVLGGLEPLRTWLVDAGVVASWDDVGLPVPAPIAAELEEYWRLMSVWRSAMDAWNSAGGLGPEPPRPTPPPPPRSS